MKEEGATTIGSKGQGWATRLVTASATRLCQMVPLVVSTAIQIAYVVGLVIVLFLGRVTIAELKGNSLLVGAGRFTLGITWWTAAFGLVKPQSRWARRFCGPYKLACAETR